MNKSAVEPLETGDKRSRRGTEGVLKMPGSIADIQGDIFYIESRAPYIMESSHVHGHVELNYLIGCSATYIVNGQVQAIPEQRLAVFWANVPHRMVDIQGDGLLYNLYIPLPLFLEWPMSDEFRQSVLSGHIILTKPDHDFLAARLQRWYEDYQSDVPELREIILGELALLLKRAGVVGWDHPEQNSVQVACLVESPTESPVERKTSDHHGSGRLKGARHVSEMIRFMAENLQRPISTADVADHLGIHRNYTTNLFSSVMGLTIKQYLQFQRLQKAQMLLIDEDRPIADIGYACGFSSLSRFYEAFQRYYGMPPGQFRKRFSAYVNTQEKVVSSRL